jgi:hypothetical protein
MNAFQVWGKPTKEKPDIGRESDTLTCCREYCLDVIFKTRLDDPTDYYKKFQNLSLVPPKKRQLKVTL